MTTTITYSFNGRDIEAKAMTITRSSITSLIDSAVDISDDYACMPNYTFVCEKITLISKFKLITYHRKVLTSTGIPVEIRFSISASRPTLLRAIKHFKSLGILQSL